MTHNTFATLENIDAADTDEGLLVQVMLSNTRGMTPTQIEEAAAEYLARDDHEQGWDGLYEYTLDGIAHEDHPAHYGGRMTSVFFNALEFNPTGDDA